MVVRLIIVYLGCFADRPLSAGMLISHRWFHGLKRKALRQPISYSYSITSTQFALRATFNDFHCNYSHYVLLCCIYPVDIQLWKRLSSARRELPSMEHLPSEQPAEEWWHRWVWLGEGRGRQRWDHLLHSKRREASQHIRWVPSWDAPLPAHTEKGQSTCTLCESEFWLTTCLGYSWYHRYKIKHLYALPYSTR